MSKRILRNYPKNDFLQIKYLPVHIHMSSSYFQSLTFFLYEKGLLSDELKAVLLKHDNEFNSKPSIRMPFGAHKGKSLRECKATIRIRMLPIQSHNIINWRMNVVKIWMIRPTSEQSSASFGISMDQKVFIIYVSIINMRTITKNDSIFLF
jgi:hypothetical protein